MEEIGEKTFEFYNFKGKKLKLTCMVYRDKDGSTWINVSDAFKVKETK